MFPTYHTFLKFFFEKKCDNLGSRTVQHTYKETWLKKLDFNPEKDILVRELKFQVKFKKSKKKRIKIEHLRIVTVTSQ